MSQERRPFQDVFEMSQKTRFFLDVSFNGDLIEMSHAGWVVNIHFGEAKFGNNYYVVNATFFTKNLI